MNVNCNNVKRMKAKHKNANHNWHDDIFPVVIEDLPVSPNPRWGKFNLLDRLQREPTPPRKSNRLDPFQPNQRL